MSQDSVIGALKLELKIGSGLEAEQARAKVDTITDEKIIAVLERVEKDYSRAGIDIDSMEIELGRVSEEDLPRVLESELRDRLDRLCGKDLFGFIPDDDIFSVEYSETEVSSSIADSTAGTWEKLSDYLSEPMLPWDAAENFNPADIVIDAAGNLLKKQGREGIDVQFSILDDIQLSRLGEIAESRLALMADRSLDYTKSASATALDYASCEDAKSSLTDSVDMTGRIIDDEADQAILMEVVASVNAILSSRTSESRKFIERSALWRSYLSYHIRKKEVDSFKQDFPEDNTSEETAIVNLNENPGTADAGKSIVDAVTFLTGSKSVTNNGYEGSGEGEAYKDPEERKELEREDSRELGTADMTSIKQDFPEDNFSEVPAVVNLNENPDTADAGKSVVDAVTSLTGSKSVTDNGHEGSEEGEAYEERTHELIQFGDRRLESVHGSQDSSNAWDAEEEEVKSTDKRLHISDAGLVLIHPFISRFMQNMKLVDEKGRFVSFEARIHAVHLLRHLTGFEGEHYEHCLTLEKVLCGLPVAYAVPTAWKASEHDEEEIDSLLNSVISYWASLSKSSTGALRLGFLQRPGSIEHEDGMYIVRVEGSAMDILLDDLPWGLSMIVLPWLEQPIIVEWQR